MIVLGPAASACLLALMCLGPIGFVAVFVTALHNDRRDD